MTSRKIQRLSMQIPENYFEGNPDQLLEGIPMDATVLVRLQIRRPGNLFSRVLSSIVSRPIQRYYIQDEESTLRRFVYSFQNRGHLFNLYDLYIDGKRCMATEMAELLTEATGYKVTI